MPSRPPNPNLGKSQALNIAQNTGQRLASLVPSLPTVLSPVTVYQPGATVGNQLSKNSNGATVSVPGTYGVWVAPDLNNGQPYSVQVECFGAGGGGGGGSSSGGGGGGGGGGYSAETQYPVKPGESYAYVIGFPGSGGANNSTQGAYGQQGTNGGATMFDIAGLGLAGGVIAYGGTGGDQGATGIGGPGAPASANTISFAGGNGGTGTSAGAGSDNPQTLLQVHSASYWTPNPPPSNDLSAWYVLDDVLNPLPGHTQHLNDASLQGRNATITNYSGYITSASNAPAQVPAYTYQPGVQGPNSTLAGTCMQFVIGATNKPGSQITTPSIPFGTTNCGLSCWIQCDPSGTWGNPAANSYAVIAANGKNYAGGGTPVITGYALYLFNAGTQANPLWQLVFVTGNGTNRYTATYTAGLTPTPGQWYYVVADYNAGAMTLYVNNAQVATASTSASFTSLPSGTYASTLGMDPSTPANWFFGYMSNVWFSQGATIGTGAIAQAYAGAGAATGGAGGGASGGPSAAGGAGLSASGATAGAGGTPATQPASLASTTTAAMGGFAGANAGLTDASPATPAGGPYGGGGGGSGNQGGPPAVTTLTVPFSAGASYAGLDATANPGTPYNIAQQVHPSTSLNSLLFAGGTASDAASGTKLSMLLLPKNLAQQVGSGSWTIINVFLTFTNAFPQNPVESVLEIGYSNDIILPQTYNGTQVVIVGAAPIPSGAGTITYDLSRTDLPAKLAGGQATALILGPANNPTFDAYNAPSGPQFYSSIYGPGAFDTFGNAQYPYLTIVLEKVGTTQQGSKGGGGAILITTVNNTATPVAFIEPFAGADSAGNAYASGYTGPISAVQPGTGTGGTPEVVETWHTVTSGFSNSWTGTLRYKFMSDNTVMIHFQGTVPSGVVNNQIIYNMPVGYRPLTVSWTIPAQANTTSITADAEPYVYVNSAGNISVYFAVTGDTLRFSGIYPTDL